jgi:hypothetical protein
MGQEQSGWALSSGGEESAPSRGGPFNTRDRMDSNTHKNSGALGNAAVCFYGPSNSQVRFPSEAFSAEQSGKLILDYPVTLADSIFQLLTIEDRDVAANVTNRAGIL